MITLVQAIGAQPFITMDYMPFTLSSDTTPNYQALLPILYYLAYDNSIRNSPPADNAVYSRVMYQLIKHCYDTHGVTYFEHWNEPDQQWLNPVMVKFFWTGDEYDLYDAYAAIATEVSADTALAGHVKLGGCSFALYSLANLIPKRFLQEVKAHSTKFDFLSFHPYSDTQFKGGYDSAKVARVEGWRNTYVPNAELINAECGRIDPNSDTWGSLDYGLYKVQHIINMLDRKVAMSFEVALFDPVASGDDYANLGMYRVGPIVPKPSAFVFYNMNRLNDVPNRLQLTINEGLYGLAGMNDAQDRIVIVLPAPDPGPGTNEVELNVSNLPWGTGEFHVERYELTDASFQQGVVSDPTMAVAGSGGFFTDTLGYPAVNGNGRLLVWELSPGPLSVGEAEAASLGFSIRPNPASDRISLQFRGPSPRKYSVSVVSAMGTRVQYEELAGTETRFALKPELGNGLYFVRVLCEGRSYVSKLVIER